MYVHRRDIGNCMLLDVCVCDWPTEVPHELAESLAPTAKERAKEQRNPKRRMDVPGWVWKE